MKSRFIELFGDPATNPKGWTTKPLLDMGYCKNGMNFHTGDSGIEMHCLGVGDFKDLSVIDGTESLPVISLNEAPPEESMLRDGDIVFVRSNGNKALVGRCLVVYPYNTPTTYSGFCIRYRLTSSEVNTAYLLRVLKADSMRKKMTGRGANIQNLNQQILATLDIPLPPIEQQQQFASFVEQADKSKFTVRSLRSPPKQKTPPPLWGRKKLKQDKTIQKVPLRGVRGEIFSKEDSPPLAPPRSRSLLCEAVRAAREGHLLTRGEGNVGGDACGNIEFVVDDVVLVVPVGTHRTVTGIDRRVCEAERLRRMGRDLDRLVTGRARHRLDARGNAEDPIVHRTVCVVVEGVHRGAPERAVLLQAVPVLPHRRCAVGDRIEPRGVLLLEQKRVRDVGVAVLGKHVQNIGRADEARRHAVAVFLYELDQLGGECGTLLLLAEVKVQNEHDAGLRDTLADDVHGGLLAARQDLGQRKLFLRHPVFHEVCAECGAHLRVKLAVSGNVLTEDLARLYDETRRICEERTRDEVVRGRTDVGVAARVHRKPVTVVHTAEPEVFLGARGTEVIDPRLHHREVLAEQRLVAVRKIDLPRRDAGNVAPGRGNTGGLMLCLRDNAADSTVFVLLLDRNVTEPLTEEVFHVEVDRGGTAEDLRVARPAETLVSLRTVGRDVEVVRLLTPDDVVVELIDLLVAADVSARALHVRVDRNRTERIGIDLVEGIFHKLDVAEALEGVGRLENVVAATRHIGAFVARGTVVRGIEVALFVQHLGVMQHDAASARCLDRYLNVARHVLSEVEDALALRRRNDGNGRETLLLGDEFTDLRNELRLDERGNGVAEHRDGRGHVDRLAVIDLGEGDGGGRDRPLFVRRNALLRAVGVGDVEPCDHRCVICKIALFLAVTHVTRRPTESEPERKGVVFCKQRGDVVGLVLDPRLVARPAGRQYALTDAHTVEVCGVKPHGGGGEHGLLYRFALRRKGRFKGTGTRTRVGRGGDPNGILFHVKISLCFDF